MQIFAFVRFTITAVLYLTSLYTETFLYYFKPGQEAVHGEGIFIPVPGGK